jgi:RimJ/RimL family protein N-acetyltransferase
VLRDGSAVVIRPVRSSDAPLLADGFARPSAESRRTRLLRHKDELSPAELRYFTRIDHHDHEALGALDDRTGRGAGVARYVRLANDPQAAEIAVTVVDAWQGRGLGTELLTRLADRARAEGIQRFTALVAVADRSVPYKAPCVPLCHGLRPTRHAGRHAEAPFPQSRKPDSHRVETPMSLTCGFIDGSTESYGISAGQSWCGGNRAIAISGAPVNQQDWKPS